MKKETLYDWEEFKREQLKWHEKIYYPIYRFFVWKIWENIRPGKWKHWYQRAHCGHSYMDKWSIDYWLVENLIPMLKEIRYDRTGTPMEFFRKKDGVDQHGNPTDRASRLAEQRWDDMLGEIIYGLKCAKALQELDYDYEDKNKTKLLNKRVEKTFTLIGKHLFTLWD